MNAHRFIANGLTLNCLDYGGEGKPPMLFSAWRFGARALVGLRRAGVRRRLSRAGAGSTRAWRERLGGRMGGRLAALRVGPRPGDRRLGIRRTDPCWAFDGCA